LASPQLKDQARPAEDEPSVILDAINKLNNKITMITTKLEDIDTKLMLTNKNIARLSANFGFVHETMVRFVATGSIIAEWTRQLHVRKPSDLLFYCANFGNFESANIMDKVKTHIEAAFPSFLEAIFTAIGKDHDVGKFLLEERQRQPAYIASCKSDCESILRELLEKDISTKKGGDTKLGDEAQAEVDRLRQDINKTKLVLSALQCIKQCYFRPGGDTFDSGLGLMVLAWEVAPDKFVASLDVDMRGELTIDAAGDNGQSSGQPAGARTITVLMGESKVGARNVRKGKDQLTLRLRVLRHFLLESGLATAGQDRFVLKGNIYISGSCRDRAEAAAAETNAGAQGGRAAAGAGARVVVADAAAPGVGDTDAGGKAAGGGAAGAERGGVVVAEGGGEAVVGSGSAVARENSEDTRLELTVIETWMTFDAGMGGSDDEGTLTDASEGGGPGPC
jgi:hypothetical protein